MKKALIETGIYEDDKNLVTKKLILKSEFKETNFYKEGQVLFNKKVPKNFDNINYRHILSSGGGRISKAIGTELENPLLENEILKSKDIKLTEIPRNTIRFALSLNPFFYYENLSHYFPSLGSLSNFIDSTNYLAGLEITFRGTASRLKEINYFDYLYALNRLLQNIEADIKNNSTEFEGSDT